MPPLPASGLHFGVARTLDEVVQAWELVYHGYRRAGLIDVNRFRIHTVPQAATSRATVLIGRISDLTVSTATTIFDSSARLPLDMVYPDELESLRREQRRIMGVGLLADRREQFSRTASAVFEVIRHVFWLAVHTQTHDMVTGVHPAHAEFYQRYFAFEPLGDARVFGPVNHNPVVGLRLNLERRLRQTPLPPGLAMYVDQPIESAAFDDKYRFDPTEVRRSVIGEYLAEQSRQTCPTDPAAASPSAA